MLRTVILFLFSCTILGAQSVPTPRMALKFDIGRDPQKWDGKLVSAKPGGFLFEFVPQGQNPDQWTELVQQQIVFSKLSVSRFVEGWKRRMLTADPKITLNEQSQMDGSILVAYASPVGDEVSVRRFIGADDGIYMVAYQVRPKLRNDSRLNLWIDIIGAASLVPNPNRQ